jgi:hypothetical protein
LFLSQSFQPSRLSRCLLKPGLVLQKKNCRAQGRQSSTKCCPNRSVATTERYLRVTITGLEKGALKVPSERKVGSPDGTLAFTLKA